MSLSHAFDWLRDLRVRQRPARRLLRAAVIVGLVSVTVGAAALAAVPAQAGTGIWLGLSISPESGPVSSVPTWSTSAACPTGFQTSAVLVELKPDGLIAMTISAAVAPVTSPFSGTLLAGDTVGSVLAAAGVTPGGTTQWAVSCGGTGGSEYVPSIDVTLSPDGSSYTTSCTGGNLCLFPASGSSSLTPAWTTLGGCPAAYLFSAALYTLNADGSLGSRISPVVVNVEGPVSGTLLADVAQDISGTGATGGEPDKWVVVCFSQPGGTGAMDYAQSMYVTLSADGSSYTTSSTPPPLTATTTTLTASPNPAAGGSRLTLTATVTVADGTNPAGSVEFEVGGSLIGGPVAVNADGVATTTSTTIFSVAGSYPLEAVYTPASSFAYASSTGTVTETVNAPPQVGSVPVTVSVPSNGAFSVTVTPGTVNLSVSGLTATGTLQDITVTDTRNTYPGWSVSGQDSQFTGAGTAIGSSIPGNQLGWTPVVVGSLQGGAALGPTVASVSPGLGSAAATLAIAAPGCGFGTNVLSANVALAIPQTAAAGPYSGTMTLTFVEAGPQNEVCVPVTVTFG